MKRKLLSLTFLCLGAATFFPACETSSRKKGRGDGVSPVTGWFYNDSRYGGYDVAMDYPGQQTPVGMVLVQGGQVTIGANDDELPT